MGDEEREEREDIQEDREEVADEATPETDEEAVEQRTDDYDGIVRRLDEMERAVTDALDRVSDRLESLGLMGIESGTAVADAAEVAENLADVVDEILGIDALDLL